MSLFSLSRVLLTPPKTPRNVFFPWQTVCIHRSGSFIESRRLCLRVPVNLTKEEIKNYLEGLYNARVLKVNTLIKVPERRRNLDDKRCDDIRLHPTNREDPSSSLESPDVRLPFRHGGVYNFTYKPEEVPQQTHVPLDLRPWRQRLSNAQNRYNK
ncbi:ribosomal protein L23, putative [Eimeria maxima]|uniref:Large ribosomal subunit protein uL23m n=1 Tax=Eimeria maxima TaxID=5804 RepID=U6M5H5_EIMMA|nr:ribosomal protein L23, putative [Eimeria maxima]CDJ56925.1 ribosomal protein L23, putative [Eimeria maxima]